SEYEASLVEVWQFIACVMLPDIVRWRFPGEKDPPITPEERFLGTNRNTFRRLWWRAHLLRDPDQRQDPYWLLKGTIEDVLSSFLDRAGMSGIPGLPVKMLKKLHGLGQSRAGLPAQDLMRDITRRLSRLGSICAFECLSTNQIDELLDEQFQISLQN